MSKSVCLSVCPQVSETMYPNLTKFSTHVTCVAVARSVCISGFVNDVMLYHNEPYGAGSANRNIHHSTDITPRRTLKLIHQGTKLPKVVA